MGSRVTEGAVWRYGDEGWGWMGVKGGHSTAHTEREVHRGRYRERLRK